MLIINKLSYCGRVAIALSQIAPRIPKTSRIAPHSQNCLSMRQPNDSGFHTLLSLKVRHAFTSSSNPNQVPLLDEVEAKVLQTIKQARPALFYPVSNTHAHASGSQTGPGLGKNQQKPNRTKPFSQMGLDSLDVTEIVIALEETFGVELTDQEARSVGSIAEAHDIFFRKVNARVTNKILERQEEANQILGRVQSRNK